MRAMLRRGAVLVALAAAATMVLAGSAQGAVTIGSNLANTANDNGPCNATACTVTNLSLSSDVAPGGLTSPVNGTVTSWRFKAQFGGHPIRLRVLRQGAGVAMTGSGSSSTVVSAIGANGPFATSLPIQVGDYVGLDADGAGEGLLSTGASGTVLYWTLPQLANGSTRDGTVYANREVLVQATVEPSNTITFGTAVLNKKKGTATLPVTIPNAGSLSYSTAGASVSGGPGSVGAPGNISLTIAATGKKLKKLKKKGKVGVSVNVSFAPTNGAAGTQSANVTLRKKLKKK
jgi:hypothetical protein